MSSESETKREPCLESLREEIDKLINFDSLPKEDQERITWHTAFMQMGSDFNVADGFCDDCIPSIVQVLMDSDVSDDEIMACVQGRKGSEAVLKCTLSYVDIATLAFAAGRERLAIDLFEEGSRRFADHFFFVKEPMSVTIERIIASEFAKMSVPSHPIFLEEVFFEFASFKGVDIPLMIRFHREFAKPHKGFSDANAAYAIALGTLDNTDHAKWIEDVKAERDFFALANAERVWRDLMEKVCLSMVSKEWFEFMFFDASCPFAKPGRDGMLDEIRYLRCNDNVDTELAARIRWSCFLAKP